MFQDCSGIANASLQELDPTLDDIQPVLGDIGPGFRLQLSREMFSKLMLGLGDSLSAVPALIAGMPEPVQQLGQIVSHGQRLPSCAKLQT